MKSMKKVQFLLVVLLSCVIFSGCEKILGYSVLLWNMGEYGMSDGDIVKVYIKSNISGVYIAELPSVGAQSTKIEIPLWQLSEPTSRKKAQEYAQKLSGYRRKYATVALDGLPIRREAENTSKQVYRLKKGETLKVLYEGQKAQIMAGNKPIEALWLYVLTQDGTEGWCFSYNLRLFNTDASGNPTDKIIEVVKEDDGTEKLTRLLSNMWYPEFYQKIVDSKIIDTERLNSENALHLDRATDTLTFKGISGKSHSKQVDINETWHYSGCEKVQGSQYRLTNIPIIVDVRRDDYIVVSYTDSSGKPQDFQMVLLSFDIDAVIQKEQDRRDGLYEKIARGALIYKSTNYGQLQFGNSGHFSWKNKKLLNSSILKGIGRGNARDTGIVKMKYLLSKNLRKSFDGVLTFFFDDSDTEVNFLYKLEDAGLRLEDANSAVIDNNILVERSNAPLVIFFQK